MTTRASVKPPLRCVIFDMDGTLTQTNQLIFDSFNFIAERYAGRRFSELEITAMFGPPEEGALLRIVGPERLEPAMEDYLVFYRSNHARLARLYPGIRELLQYLRERSCFLGLFTGKGTKTTNITLEEFHLTPYFDCVVTGNDVVNHKPSAEGIHRILRAANVPAAEALMVGDSVSDIKASREAGVEIAAVVWDSYGKQKVLDAGSDHLFHDVQEFSTWLRRRCA